jgi:hypothetical protein
MEESFNKESQEVTGGGEALIPLCSSCHLLPSL